MQLERKYTLRALVWPIFIEMFLQSFIGTVDTMMVSHISDNAVAAVGICNQFFMAVFTLVMLVNGGAGIVIGQKLGAQQVQDAKKVAAMAVKINLVTGALLSIMLAASNWTLQLLNVPEEVMPNAELYMHVVGGGIILMTMMMTMNTIIRNTGNTRGPLYIAIGMNLVHIVLNYTFIFGPAGLPQLGMEGVAISTLLSRSAALLACYWLFRSCFGTPFRRSDYRGFSKPLLGEMFRIGWPMSLNSGSWTMTQTMIFSFAATMGAHQLAALTYMNTIQSFSYMLGFSFAMAAQIQIAYLYGAGEYEKAYRSAWVAVASGMSVVMAGTTLIVLFGRQALSIFTSEPEVIALGVTLLALNFILQPGKMVNMAISSGLNAIGDTKFVMWSSVLSMWLVAAGGSYWFGLSMGWGLVGIYIAMITDEWLRGTLLMIRWRRRKHLNAAAGIAEPASAANAVTAAG